MYFATNQLEAVFSAAGNLQKIGEGAQLAASTHLYKAFGAQAAPVHEVFMSTLSAGNESSATTEAVDAIAAG